MATDSNTKSENESKAEGAEPEDRTPGTEVEKENTEKTGQTGKDKKSPAPERTVPERAAAEREALQSRAEGSDSGRDDSDLDDEDFDEDILAAHDTGKDATGSRAWGMGAGAVVTAGLGLASLVGTSLSDMLRERKALIGQIESSAQGQSGSASDQVNAIYGAPWHAAAMINGIFALLAVVVGGVLLAALSNRRDARPWVKAVCLGGLVLGVVGLVVAGGMYFDLFASAPEIPKAPSTPAQ